MKIIFKDFLKGIFFGLFLLPLEFVLLSSLPTQVKAEENLRDQIRSQIPDLRETRPELDIREPRPCDVDPVAGCSRPIPSHRPSAEPTPTPGPSSLPSPVPSPSSTPGPSVSPSSEPGKGGDGGSSSSSSSTSESQAESKPQVLGLSFTCSGNW